MHGKKQLNTVVVCLCLHLGCSHSLGLLSACKFIYMQCWHEPSELLWWDILVFGVESSFCLIRPLPSDKLPVDRLSLSGFCLVSLLQKAWLMDCWEGSLSDLCRLRDLKFCQGDLWPQESIHCLVAQILNSRGCSHCVLPLSKQCELWTNV